jgi:enoyl-CoA hydratase/carnithine racemase
MIHDPSGMVMGTSADMRAMAEVLDKIGGSLLRGYAAKSGKAEDEIAKLMAKETWLDAGEALEMGFADTMVEPVKMAASFDVSRFQNTPPEVVEAVKAKDEPAVVEPEPATAEKPEPVPDPAAIRGEAMTYAKTVVDLCRLAGQSQMAASFLSVETSLEDIRKALIDAKAANEPDISSSHSQPGSAPQAKPWGDVIARTFKGKG